MREANLLDEHLLKSWAVPRGASTDPAGRRRAIPTEDHGLGYADFEGGLPDDEYGGGTVLVWDAGSFTNRKTGDDGEPVDDGDPVPLDRQLEEGEMTLWLHGERIRGRSPGPC